MVGGDIHLCRKYTLRAIDEDALEKAVTIVLMNLQYHAGRCYMSFVQRQDEKLQDCARGAIPESEIAVYLSLQTLSHAYMNVCFDADKPSWSRFLEDERYRWDGLGVWEGACTYPIGVWRPSENSIMNSAPDGFNAPSREAIWLRLHKLAFGPEWEYDY